MKTLRVLAFLFGFLAVATPTFAGNKLIVMPPADSVSGNTTPEYTGPLTVTGPLTLNESPGTELLTQTCAGWGLTTPVGASSCASDTITRTASGANLTLTNTAASLGVEYKIDFAVATVTAGSVTFSAGAISCAAVSAARTQTCYLPPGTTGAATVTFGATFAGTITVSTTSMKVQQTVITPNGGPVVVAKTLASATENEAAMTVISNQTGGGANAGDKTALRVVNIGSGTGTEYVQEWYAGATRMLSLTAAGLLQLGSTAQVIPESSNVPLMLSARGQSIAGNGVSIGNNTNTGTSGSYALARLVLTYNQASGTATNTDLFISRTETALGSGAQKIISAQAGAAGTTEVFKLDNKGMTTQSGGENIVQQATLALTGSIDPTASTTLTGVGTRFLSELMPGDKITVSAETRIVTAIASDTSLTVDTATTDTANDASVDRYPVGLSITAADSSVGTDIFVNAAVKSSGNLMDLRVGGASKFFITSSGAATLDGGTLKISSGSPGTTGAINSDATLGNAANAVFVFRGKPVIHSAGTDLEGFRFFPDLSNNHTGGNVIGFSAPDLVSADADIVKYGAKIGTGYNTAFSSPNFSVAGATGIISAGGGSASATVCWKADGITLGYCSGGLVGVCGTCN